MGLLLLETINGCMMGDRCSFKVIMKLRIDNFQLLHNLFFNNEKSRVLSRITNKLHTLWEEKDRLWVKILELTPYVRPAMLTGRNLYA